MLIGRIVSGLTRSLATSSLLPSREVLARPLRLRHQTHPLRLRHQEPYWRKTPSNEQIRRSGAPLQMATPGEGMPIILTSFRLLEILVRWLMAAPATVPYLDLLLPTPKFSSAARSVASAVPPPTLEAYCAGPMGTIGIKRILMAPI